MPTRETTETGTDTDRADVVVVGSGVGGLAAAVTAADAGLSVIVLEKASVFGGSSGLSGAQLWMPANRHMDDVGVDDSVDEGVDYMAALAGEFYANRDAARRYIEAAADAIGYFEDEIGLELQVIGGMPDYHTSYPGAKSEGRYLEPQPISRDEIPATLPNSPHLPGGATNDELLTWGGAFTAEEWDWDVIGHRREEDIATMGTALIGYFLRAADERGVECYANAGVTDLLVDDNAVTGVEVESQELPTVIRADEGVVLATGAYDWNPDMVESFEDTPSEQVVSAAVPTATGDGHRLAANCGAKLGTYPPIGGAKGFFIAVPDREFLDAPLYRYCYNIGLPHAIAINADGERFCDESFYPEQAAELYDPTGEYPQFPSYMVFDESYRQRYPLGNTKPGDPYPDEFLAGKATTLEELAEQLSIDGTTLRATVERFNEGARRGEDPEFHRGENEWANLWCGDPNHEPNPNLGPIEDPPFYAVRLYVGLSSMSNTGLVTDDHGRVVDWDEVPIGGLYATGSVCAPVEWGIGYQSGLQNGRSLTYGFLAGSHLAAQAQAEN